MNKPVQVRLATARILRLATGVILLVLVGWAFNARAQTLTNLHSFTGGSDAYGSGAVLVEASDGYFYGTTVFGGTSTNCETGCGTVFRMSPSSSLTNLYSFSLSDGAFPSGGLVQGSDGSFYGTTLIGGMNNSGTVFRISSSGGYTNLYTFGSSPNDGANPYAGLVQGSDGYFYGTTEHGGAKNLGTVFRISSSGSLTNLHSFKGYPSDGQLPYATLVQGSDGNFYGTTYTGGAIGDGTVFRISSSGSLTDLWSFSQSDGGQPHGGVVRGADGNFYGTTSGGGINNDGTVFRISPSGSLTNLYSFSGSDGSDPQAALVQGSDGNFYGTTLLGGHNNDGTVFRISPSGSLTTLYFLCDQPACSDGYYPNGGPVQGSDGNFYGSAAFGGTSTNCPTGCGTLFILIVPLNPPANQISAVQSSGTNIVITIPSVVGETYQLQFSSSMTPTNWVNVPGVSVTNSIGALLTLTNFGGAVGPQGFYRFDITP